MTILNNRGAWEGFPMKQDKLEWPFWTVDFV